MDLTAILILSGIVSVVVILAMANFNTIVTFSKNIRGLLGQEEKAATADRQEETNRLLRRLIDVLAPPPVGAAKPDIDALSKSGGPDTPGLLKEALGLQAENREREAIAVLYEAFRRDLEPRAKSELHVLMGNSYLHLSDATEAGGHYKQARELSQKCEDRRQEGNAIGGLGLVASFRGHLEQAEDYFNQALLIEHEIGDRAGEAITLGNLGTVFGRRGDFDEAILCFHEAEGIDRQIGDRRGEANALGNLGNVYQIKGDLAKAEDHHQRALSIDREIKYRLGEAQDLGNLGNVYQDQGDLAKAKDHHEQALLIDREIGYRLGEAIRLGNLGLVAADANDRDEACQRLRKSLSIYDEIGAGGEGPDNVRAALEELGCDEEAQEPSASEDAGG